VSKIGNGLLEGWWMFFDTFWALVLGFTLSGLIQAFVSRKRMRELLGDHKPRTIARASIFGMVSSSCSYAASALAKSLFARGADFTASMIFMFASTNLVIELGLVIWILIGWQFAAAEFVGGAVMITLLALLIPRLIPARLIDALSQESSEVEISNEMGVTAKATIRDAAGYTIGDFTMLRGELVIGFIVAGLASTLVPTSFWNGLFLTGHGLASSIENVVIGPFIAFISFVCSVGNVPLAGALWNGGISFGGTISFIFADLIALPLVLIYRKYYGTKLAIRLTLVFWLVMSLSGLITEYLFKLIAAIPATNSMLPMTSINMSQKHFGLNFTTILNVIALAVLILVFWLYKSRSGTDLASGYAKDWVCGMQVEIANAPATYMYEGQKYFFCMPGCKESFAADPKKYLAAVA
jgi:uncharacterized membrane protein YraQ (UPF0718 family)/YHS domain-containing protein